MRTNAVRALTKDGVIKRRAISKEIGGKSFLECVPRRGGGGSRRFSLDRGSNGYRSYIVNGYMRRRRDTNSGPRTVIVTRLRERFRWTRRRRSGALVSFLLPPLSAIPRAGILWNRCASFTYASRRKWPRGDEN